MLLNEAIQNFILDGTRDSKRIKKMASFSGDLAIGTGFKEVEGWKLILYSILRSCVFERVPAVRDTLEFPCFFKAATVSGRYRCMTKWSVYYLGIVHSQRANVEDQWLQQNRRRAHTLCV